MHIETQLLQSDKVNIHKEQNIGKHKSEIKCPNQEDHNLRTHCCENLHLTKLLLRKHYDMVHSSSSKNETQIKPESDGAVESLQTRC